MSLNIVTESCQFRRLGRPGAAASRSALTLPARTLMRSRGWPTRTTHTPPTPPDRKLLRADSAVLRRRGT
jgi:hypothetical protein